MLSAVEVCDQSGLTYRMLDYWVRRGVIVHEPLPAGAGSGRPRVFTDAELRVVRVLAALRTLGVRLDTLIEVAEQLRAWPESEFHGFVFVDDLAGLQRTPCSRCIVLDLDDVLDVASCRGQHPVVVEGVSRFSGRHGRGFDHGAVQHRDGEAQHDADPEQG